MSPAATSSVGVVRLRYENIRNLTSPEEKANGARSYFANVPISELMKLDTAANLRSYIPGHPGKKRTLTHKAIGETLRGRSDRFIQLSSGIAVSAADVEIDDNKKIVTVTNGSIINGAQTQGEIALFMEEMKENDETQDFHARVEFIVDPDSEFIVETAIARNTSTNVQRISMVGKKQYLDDLDASFIKLFPDKRLSKSETEVGDEFVDTQRVLQVLWAMMPEQLLSAGKRSVADARLKSYKNRAYCLVDFEADVLAKDKDASAHARYKYFVEMVGHAWREYLKWRHHEGWQGKYLKTSTRAVRRTDDGLTVADGVIFPIISAMSHFVNNEKNGRWRLQVSKIFDENEMLDAARDQLSAHSGNPMLMGRNAAVYEALSLLPKMVLRVSNRVSTAA